VAEDSCLPHSSLQETNGEKEDGSGIRCTLAGHNVLSPTRPYPLMFPLLPNSATSSRHEPLWDIPDPNQSRLSHGQDPAFCHCPRNVTHPVGESPVLRLASVTHLTGPPAWLQRPAGLHPSPCSVPVWVAFGFSSHLAQHLSDFRNCTINTTLPSHVPKGHWQCLYHSRSIWGQWLLWTGF
jgi:hypothetical protein